MNYTSTLSRIINIINRIEGTIKEASRNGRIGVMGMFIHGVSFRAPGYHRAGDEGVLIPQQRSPITPRPEGQCALCTRRLFGIVGGTSHGTGES